MVLDVEIRTLESFLDRYCVAFVVMMNQIEGLLNWLLTIRSTELLVGRPLDYSNFVYHAMFSH